MAILLALLGGALSFVNLFLGWNDLLLQAVFTVCSLSSMIFYRGTRTRQSYERDGTRIFTFGFGLCFLSFLGSASILIMLYLGGQ